MALTAETRRAIVAARYTRGYTRTWEELGAMFGITAEQAHDSYYPPKKDTPPLIYAPMPAGRIEPVAKRWAEGFRMPTTEGTKK